MKRGLGGGKGWLDDDDPFFAWIDARVAARSPVESAEPRAPGPSQEELLRQTFGIGGQEDGLRVQERLRAEWDDRPFLR